MTVAARDVEAAASRATEAIDERKILDALAALMAVSGGPGRERSLAEHVARWGGATYPDLEWSVDQLDGESANLVARSASGSARRELGLYAHLDTSLTGDPGQDLPVTGETSEPAAFYLDEATRTIRGLGVGIARAPAAAAIVALSSAAVALQEIGAPRRISLLLAAGGTHRAAAGAQRPVAFGRGVAHALDGGWRPDAVLNVKGGPPGVLYQEPATAYLVIRVRTRWTAALVRATVAPHGGLARNAGIVLDAVEGWRSAYLRAHPPSGQLGGEISIGAIRSGSDEKADLIPGVLEVFLYAVLPPDADSARTARELEHHLRSHVKLPMEAKIAVEAYAFAPGGSTDPSAEIVRLAREAWRTHLGTDPGAIRGWTGATDGALLMARGIPVARFGAGVKRDMSDPRIELVDMGQLIACARGWAEVAVRYCAA